ncbi:MAG: hypothetical protein JJU06_14775 [Ectothiorhodospiraceae bacterium]|nr:hypothetical protein [Ectothiorhodospiraceae bacterium]MCH8505382.1 hypothetical protein [Ectothiorhodospiraceae bacterium]
MSTTRDEKTPPDPAGAQAGGAADSGLFAEAGELASVLAAALQDLARLLRLEARLLVRAALMMAVLAVFLALVLAASWLALSAAIAIALQQHTGLSMAGAALLSAVLNLLAAGAAALALKRLARRLTFPETRYALQAFWLDAEQQKK